MNYDQIETLLFRKEVVVIYTILYAALRRVLGEEKVSTPGLRV